MLLKRAFDILLGGLALLILSPFLLLIGVVVWLASGCPVLYSQERVGRGFRPFRIWKFRTMRTDNSGPPITAAGDPRITPVGKVLRRTKLDELPQLWNVFKGDMSLVGPRPEVPRYVALYRERYAQILKVRPGLTDFASVIFRNEEVVLGRLVDPERHYIAWALPHKLELAEEYISRRTLYLDLAILFQTAIVVIKQVVRCG